MRAAVVPTSLKDIEKALEIGIGISVRLLDGIAHACLRSEMNDNREFVFAEQRRDRGSICQIRPHKAKARLAFQQLQPRLLQSRIVIAVDAIEANDRAAFGQQLPHQMKTDEARSTGDKNG